MVGRLTLPPLGLVVLAAIGAVLLLVVALDRWATPSDEHAYWLAARRLVDGLPIYDIAMPVGTPYAYWYPPPLAQALAPLTLFAPTLRSLPRGRCSCSAACCSLPIGASSSRSQ